ncbi:MAG: LutB/LldF family L-lactate oxidation iron-sulfur protein [Eggerthellaceae bacterium]
MSILYYQGTTLDERVNNSLSDDFKHNAIKTAQETFYNKRRKLVSEMPEWESYRQAARNIRQHVNDNLDFYVREFVENTTKRGNIVHLAPTAEDAINEVIDICESVNAKHIVKSKSMMSEEIGVNDELAAVGVQVTETDCAEHIIQTAGDKPSHIVVPALHFDRKAIAELYRKKRGYTGTDNPEEITHFLRHILRREFLTADIGMRGCNFPVASTGSLTLVTNEGNGRMVDSIPQAQIVLAGIDRLVPDLDSLDVMMALLVRSSVGAKMTNYFTIDSGPRRDGENDGPREVHVILIDNGRSSLLGTEFRPMMRCIRCGACLNTCPVYRHITGHGYGSIYPGPMGIVLTPALLGYEQTSELPYACSLCGACDDDCPVKIPLHELILKHRMNIVDQGQQPHPVEVPIFQAAGAVLGNRPLYDASIKVASFGMKALSRGTGSLDDQDSFIPVLGSWLQTRDLDNAASIKFRDWFAQRERHHTSTQVQERNYITVSQEDLDEFYASRSKSGKGNR